jgi:DNA polymerase elongation subunit (family B)
MPTSNHSTKLPMSEKKTKERALVYDIECRTADGKPNPSKDELRVFGCYSYATEKYYLLTKVKDVKRIVSYHDCLVGFNNFLYDNMVLKRYLENELRVSFHKRYSTFQAFFKSKHNIDLSDVFENRVKIIMIGKTLLDDILLRFDLGSISRAIGITEKGEEKVKDFDYSLFHKTVWTAEEKKKVRDYTLRDIVITKRMYEWLEDYFGSFKDFVAKKDVQTKAYLTCSPSVFAYKAICNQLGLEEEYEEVKEEGTYGGGYVAHPAGESFDDRQGDIYLLDFKSLYPHVMLQCNLFSPSSRGWNGNDVFKTTGTYNDTQLGPIEKFLLSTCRKREQYKRTKNPREYALKIVMNSIYGLSSSKRFKHLYRPNTAPDCTALGRQWIQLARRRFREAGYTNIFSDTDSVYALDKHRDKRRFLDVKDKVIKEIKANVPFPSDTFDMEVDDEITNIWFFRGGQKKDEEDKYMDEEDYINKRKGLLKKNYLYLTKQGEAKIKNLGVRKKSASMLARHIFWNVLLLKIKAERRVKFSRTFFDEVINQLLRKNLGLAAIRYNVSAFETYKIQSQLQAQIAKRYGPGIHFLIPNKRYGVGKRKFYCTVGEFKQNKLSLHDIDLENVWQELHYFIEEEPPSLNLIQRTAKPRP